MRYRVSRPFTKPSSSNYWFRITVPKDLRTDIGQREIHQSLGTSDLTEAVILEAKLTAKWKDEFRRRRAQAVREHLATAPEVVDRFLRQLSNDTYGDLDGVILGIQKLITVSLLTAWGPEEYRSRQADLALGFMPKDEDWVDSQDDALADVIPDAERDLLIARMRVLHRHPLTFSAVFCEAIQHIKDGKRWDAVRFHILMISVRTGVEISFPSAFYDAVAEAFIDRLLNYRSYQRDPELLALLSPAPRPESGSGANPSAYATSAPANAPSPADWANAGTRSRPEQTLTAAHARWKDMVKPGASAITETTRSVERFVELFGDKHIAQITPNDIFDYRDFLQNMPAGISLPAVRASGADLRSHVARIHAEEEKLIAEAERKGLKPPEPRRLSPQSVKKDVGGLSAIFSAAVSDRWILSNPAAGVPIDGYSKRRKVLPLKPSMMKDLFASSMFTGCEGQSGKRRTRPGPYVYQDVLYWSFLFGATSGHRLSELATALMKDVEESEGPDGETIVGIFVTDDVKNEHSERVILVHPKLLDLGFLDYVNARRKTGATMLFDLPKGGTKKLSERVNNYLDWTIVDDRRFVFHSLRHEFADRSEINISVEVSKKIMGHARGRLYGLGAPLYHAANELKKLDVSFIDWDRLLVGARRSPR